MKLYSLQYKQPIQLIRQQQLLQLQKQQQQKQQQQQINSIIPLNLFQTWHTLNLPPNMKKNVELLKAQNPEFTHYLYDDNMCREFIKANFNEDVVYSFNKLKPGAYKADLWRYCVLYIYGGIYLDIKYKCINNFKLLYLTDNEYWVRDRKIIVNGIYQALMVNLPKNPILLKAINGIVKNCKNNVYTDLTPLCVTGPGHLAQFFNENEIKSLTLAFTDKGDGIIKDNRYILSIYPEYRQEQQQTQLAHPYEFLWHTKNIYNYPTLQSIKKTDISRQIIKNIKGKNIVFFSGTPTIIESPDNKNNNNNNKNSEYLINIRWINYNYNNNGSKKIQPTQWISLNSRFKMDRNFNKISDEIFLKENFNNSSNLYPLGLEDIRIFKHNDEYYYIAAYFYVIRKLTSICSGIYNIDIDIDPINIDPINIDIDPINIDINPLNNSYKLDTNIILPLMYDLNTNRIWEKNWSFVEYKNTLCVIYKWYPLQIGTIDYNEKNMNIIETKDNIPDYFKNARGSTCGFKNNNEIWFIVHISQMYKSNNIQYYNYQHFFAVFSLDMNLIRYSELFKFGDCKVEFCTGLIIKGTEIILSYSLLDTQSIIATYDMDYINTGIKWYK